MSYTPDNGRHVSQVLSVASSCNADLVNELVLFLRGEVILQLLLHGWLHGAIEIFTRDGSKRCPTSEGVEKVQVILEAGG